MGQVASVLAFLACEGCGATPGRDGSARVGSASNHREEVSSEPAAPPFASSPPPAEFVEISVPGFHPAVVALPADMSRPRPALVAAHGAGDGPEWQCALWRTLLGARGFVLCPAGVPFGKSPESGYFFRNHHELEREVLAGVEALRAAFPDELDPGPLVYAGYSQGATMGALMLVGHGEIFPRLALIEGGYSEWNVSIGKRFAANGGQRVLFACGIASCQTKAERCRGWLEGAGIASRVEYAPGAGHTYGGAVAERVSKALDWLLEGDERWR